MRFDRGMSLVFTAGILLSFLFASPQQVLLVAQENHSNLESVPPGKKLSDTSVQDTKYPKESDVLATVDGHTIRLADVRFFLKGLKANDNRQQASLDSFFQLDQKKKEEKPSTELKIPLPVVKLVTIQIAKRWVLFSYLKSKNRLVSKEEIQKQILQIEKTLGKKTFQQILTKRHGTKELLADHVQFLRSWKRFQNKVLDENRLKKFFVSHQKRFDGSYLKVAHILLSRKQIEKTSVSAARQKMESIQKNIKEKKVTFGEAAKKYSSGVTAAKGGTLGWISFEGPMSKEFTQAAFQLNVDEVSPVVTSPFGFHIIKILEHKKGERKYEEVVEHVRIFAEKELVRRVFQQTKEKASVSFSKDFFDEPITDN